METSKIQSIRLDAYEKAVEHLLNQPKIKRIFSKWERNHLAALTSCYSSYKVTLPTKNKARTISHLDSKLRLDFVTYIQETFDPDPSAITNQQRIAEEFFKDFLLYLTTNSDEHKIPDYSKLDALNFINPEIQEHLIKLLTDYDAPSLSGSSNMKENKTDNEINSKESKPESLENHSELTSVEDALLSYYLSKLGSSEKQNSQLGQCFDALALMTSQNSSLHHAITRRIDKSSVHPHITKIQDKLGVRVKDLIEPSAETYKVILEDIKKLPHDAGYVGEVVAVLGMDGNLVCLSKKMTEEFFPQRGSVYISHSNLKEIPIGYKYLPIIAKRTLNYGINDYRLQESWNEAVEIIDLKYDLFEIDLLINAIKEYRFSGSNHDVWFRLRDGALLSSTSRKQIYNSQVFHETWRFIDADSANKLRIRGDFALSSELSNYSSISMMPDIELTKTLSELIRVDGTIPEHIANRKPYISDERNINLSSSEFIEDLVSTYSNSEALRPLIEEHISIYVQEFEEEIIEIKNRKVKIEGELSATTKELEAQKKRQEGLLKHLDTVLKPKIDNIKKDVVTALQDPTLIGLFGTVKDNAVSNLQPYQQTQRLGTLRLIETHNDRVKILSRLKLKFLDNKQLDALENDVKYLTSKGYTFELIGEKSHDFAQLLLSLCNLKEYFNIFSFFAENIEDCLNLINERSPSPIVINGVDEHQSKFYKAAFESTKNLRELDSRLIIAVSDVFAMSNCKQVIPLNIDLIYKAQEERDFDISELSDICSEYGLNKLRFDDGAGSIIYDLLFSTLSELGY